VAAEIPQSPIDSLVQPDSAAVLQAIFDVLPAWVFYKDKENRLIRVNQTFADVMQMTKEQLEGVSCFDLYPREEAKRYWQDDKEVMASGTPKAKIVESVTLADGLHWVQTEKIPLCGPDGEAIGIIGFSVDITERKLMEDRMRDLATTDDLTGLSNRRGFFVRAEDSLRLALRTHKSCALIVVDVDNLKCINDAFGHAGGDEAILATADVLRQVFRKSDVIARLGGDEFAILAFDVNAETAVDAISRRIVAQVDALNRGDARAFPLSVSYGAALSTPADRTPIAELILQADQAMYAQKRSKGTAL
jgi:diguanylate cyclase (GGDEF)-like protein/PAS domain S-box-containing protein